MGGFESCREVVDGRMDTAHVHPEWRHRRWSSFASHFDEYSRTSAVNRLGADEPN